MNPVNSAALAIFCSVWVCLPMDSIGDSADTASSPLSPRKITWEEAQTCTNAARVVILCVVDTFENHEARSGTNSFSPAQLMDWRLSGVINLAKHADTAGKSVIDPGQIRIFYVECGEEAHAKARLMHERFVAGTYDDSIPAIYVFNNGALLDWYSYYRNAGTRGVKLRTLVREVFNPEDALALPPEAGAAAKGGSPHP